MADQDAKSVSKEQLAAARKRAQETREKVANKPPLSELLTSEEVADGAPFYFVLRHFIRQLKQIRESKKITLADVSDKTGMAVEYLSRLENGAQTNPTWKTLASYALALECKPILEVACDPAHSDNDS